MKYLILIVLSLLTFTSATYVDQCNGYPFPLNVEVENCHTQPCHLTSNTHQRIKITMQVLYDIDFLTPRLIAKHGLVTEEYLLLETDGCRALDFSLGIFCPIPGYQEFTYVLDMMVKDYIINPKKLRLTFTMKDQFKKVIGCFEMDAKVLD